MTLKEVCCTGMSCWYLGSMDYNPYRLDTSPESVKNPTNFLMIVTWTMGPHPVFVYDDPIWTTPLHKKSGDFGDLFNNET